MKVYLDKVTAEKKDILFRLLEYSLYEESLNDGNDINEEGIYEYQYFDDYFKENNRIAYFIREEDTNKLLGFVMINTYMQKTDKGHSIAEFMILPKYRKKHIGKSIAFQCFDLYKGNWEVSPSFGSEAAYQFWKKTIDEYTNKKNEYIDRLFLFNNE